MIIKNLAFSVFCKVFKEHDDLFVGVGFTDHSTVDVLLTSAVTWHITRRVDSGQVTLRSEESEEHKAHLFFLDTEDFEEITIC